MTLNYAFAFSFFLFFFVGLNIYFFYTLNTVGGRPASIKVPNVKPDVVPSAVSKDIYDHLNYLPNRYINKNPKFVAVQKDLLHSFNSTNNNINTKDVWLDIEKVRICCNEIKLTIL